MEFSDGLSPIARALADPMLATTHPYAPQLFQEARDKKIPEHVVVRKLVHMQRTHDRSRHGADTPDSFWVTTIESLMARIAVLERRCASSSSDAVLIKPAYGRVIDAYFEFRMASASVVLPDGQQLSACYGTDAVLVRHLRNLEMASTPFRFLVVTHHLALLERYEASDTAGQAVLRDLGMKNQMLQFAKNLKSFVTALGPGSILLLASLCETIRTGYRTGDFRATDREEFLKHIRARRIPAGTRSSVLAAYDGVVKRYVDALVVSNEPVGRAAYATLRAMAMEPDPVKVSTLIAIEDSLYPSGSAAFK